jgi:uncharacterized Zn-binding protein involved in type VI secretion
MPAVQRQGDPNSAGGVIMSGINSVLVNGRPIAVSGLRVSAHPCCGQRGCPPVHCSAVTQGRGTVFVNGRPVVATGDSDSCKHSRVGGSPNVRVGR